MAPRYCLVKNKSLKTGIAVVLLSCLCAVCSCYTYRPLVITRKDSPLRGGGHEYGDTDTLNNTIYKWEWEKPHTAEYSKITKYIVMLGGKGPVAFMNNRAVYFALEERLFEAGLLLREALEDDPDEPALYNNLGIVYEMQKKYKEAFSMYMRSCLLDDENPWFRLNFLTLEEHKVK